jgi:hypothetical protein
MLLNLLEQTAAGAAAHLYPVNVGSIVVLVPAWRYKHDGTLFPGSKY